MTNPFMRIPKERIIFICKRILMALLPLRPYADCDTAQTCPCPIGGRRHVTGIAIGDDVTLNMRSREMAERTRIEFPQRKEIPYACLPQPRP